MDILAVLAQLAPSARDVYKESFARLDKLADAGMLDNPLRLAHFLSQCCHESTGMMRLSENLNYSTPRLMAVWPRRFPTTRSARPFAHNPRALANYVYGGRLGNVEPEDGWKFIGRGLLQLTGRANYERVGLDLGIDMIADPYLPLRADYAVPVALSIWRQAGCDALADNDDLLAVTRRINGGLNGLADRRNWLTMAKAVIGGEVPGDDDDAD